MAQSNNTRRNYFSHDTNARHSDRLIKLRMKHGAAGYGVFFMIIERLMEEKDYMSVKDYNMIAFDLRVDASLIKSVVEDFGLFVFTENGKYFYSDSLRKRILIMDNQKKTRSAAAKNAANSRWSEEKSDADSQAVNASASKSDANGMRDACTKNADASQSHAEEKKRKVAQKKSKEIIREKDIPPLYSPHEEKGADELFLDEFFSNSSIRIEEFAMTIGCHDRPPWSELRPLFAQAANELVLAGRFPPVYSDRAWAVMNLVRKKYELIKKPSNENSRRNQSDRRRGTEPSAATESDFKF